MTKYGFLATMAALVSFTGTSAVTAQQPGSPTLQPPAANQQDDRQPTRTQNDQDRQRGDDRNQADGAEQRRQDEQRDQADASDDANESYEARRVSSDRAQHGALTVKEAIVKKLIKSNEAEIELAKMAMDKTDNQQLKQLTQMIVRDHQQLNETLRQFSSHGASDRDHSRTSSAQPGTTTRPGVTTQPGVTTRPGIAGQPGVPTQPRTTTPPLRSSEDPLLAANDRTQTHQAQRPRLDASSATVPQELQQIALQACDNALQMTKEMLKNYDGQDFDMAFLSQQAVAHTMAVAELQAIESTGPEELQPVAQKALSAVKKHLEQTKQLAKKLEDDRRNRDRS